MQEQKELYRQDNGMWGLYPYIINCTDNGVQEQKYDADKTFYEKMAEKRSNFILNEVIEIEYTPEQIIRLEEVQGIDYKHYDELYDYVINGIVRADSKIFTVRNIVKLDKSINEQSEILADIMGGVY